jgi:hypothetical protein
MTWNILRVSIFVFILKFIQHLQRIICPSAIHLLTWLDGVSSYNPGTIYFMVKFDYGVFHIYRSWVVALFLLENRNFLGFWMIFKVWLNQIFSNFNTMLWTIKYRLKTYILWYTAMCESLKRFGWAVQLLSGNQKCDGWTWGSLYTPDSCRAGV